MDRRPSPDRKPPPDALAARTRADNARNYLVGEKGIDPSRIEVRVQERTAADGGIEIAIIPPGAQAP